MSKFLKFWVLIICLLFIFLILFTDRVKAETITTYMIGNNGFLPNEAVLSSSNTTYERTLSSKFVNFGEGQIYFTFSTFSGSIGVTAVSLWTNSNTGYTCQLGTTNGYTDSNTQFMMYTSICNVSNVATNGIVKIKIEYLGGGTGYIQFGDFWTGLKGNPTQQDYTTILNNIKSDTARIVASNDNINNNMNSINTKIDTIISNIQNNQTTIIQNIANNTQAIEDQTQQQHNDAQQQFNYISDTSISNQNYTDAQNISENNTNTQTKSVVMNFWLIPLNFFNSIIASFENTCTQVCVGECGSGHDNAWRFVFPCLDIKGFVGNTIYNTIDAFFAIGMIFAFVKRAKNFFINALMLTNDVASEVSVF